MEESTSTKKPLIHHDWTKEDHGEYRRKIVRESQRKRREQAKEQGLCQMCARNLPRTGYTTCEACYTRVRAWQDKRRKK